jgi:hypothetical protein
MKKKGALMTKFQKTSTLGLLISAICLSVNADEYPAKTGWQTPEAAEFSRLDTSGNGLLKRNEVGKAFTKKTFDKADVDHDGNIDQNEYVYYKTGAWPENMQAPQTSVPTGVNPTTDPATEMPAEVVPAPNDGVSLNNLNDEGVTAELQNLIDAHEQALAQAQETANVIANKDHIINAKAVTSILSTDDLEGVQISVATYDGEVMLNGFVKSHQDKMKAEYVVSKISGVKAVINDLVVRS